MEDPDFQEKFKDVLRNDEIGDNCRKEKLIVDMGQKLFGTIGNANPLQRRRTTGVMRRLETLFQNFKIRFKNYSPNLLDMFSRKLHKRLI